MRRKVEYMGELNCDLDETDADPTIDPFFIYNDTALESATSSRHVEMTTSPNSANALIVSGEDELLHHLLDTNRNCLFIATLGPEISEGAVWQGAKQGVIVENFASSNEDAWSPEQGNLNAAMTGVLDFAKQSTINSRYNGRLALNHFEPDGGIEGATAILTMTHKASASPKSIENCTKIVSGQSLVKFSYIFPNQSGRFPLAASVTKLTSRKKEEISNIVKCLIAKGSHAEPLKWRVACFGIADRTKSSKGSHELTGVGA